MRFVGLTAGLFVWVAAGAPAMAVPVLNSSFETPVLAAGASPGGSFTGWTSGVAGGGLLGADPTNFTAPDGNQVAYTGPGNGALIYQDTGIPVVAGDTYALSAYVGQLANIGNNLPLYDYRILVGWGGHDLATAHFLLGESGSYTTNGGFAGLIAPDSFALVQNGGVADAGASGNLLIFLDGGNANSFGVSGEALWDSVTLNDTSAGTVGTSVPKPASFLMLGTGLLGIAATRRRRKAKA
jgi:hypothetical protein